ncbi:MAG: hypothetical protein FWG67_08020 [Defluviitaleaceae bacterium]|nr:hypothetical protein [Defluviitaleaceae bacterium]
MATRKNREQNEKTMHNNQWTSPNTSSSSKAYKDKTATHNEWTSTHLTSETTETKK